MDNQYIKISGNGTVTFIYSDDWVDLLDEGKTTIRRASHVEPTPDGKWTADMGPSGGPVLGPFTFRREALDAEIIWLNDKLFGGIKWWTITEI